MLFDVIHHATEGLAGLALALLKGWDPQTNKTKIMVFNLLELSREWGNDPQKLLRIIPATPIPYQAPVS